MYKKAFKNEDKDILIYTSSQILLLFLPFLRELKEVSEYKLQ